ncbi:hypothetical protein BV394_01975 [Brevirhabdus pacifica]|uniref:Uncharacterized protein n=1 Tax=Brevirhabdus pacifica TaxID=1267768 RepID=A0A1U7DFH0_9RHOB|nr:hypothetical protein [Brevirhabdus pacifica]APX88649.1 hypothetical protein BV394_01975 [Brevirhabdus pacifica]OWU79922.1 hypothetical protein ATO5_02665 [Loktanella sp. 22II-4b]PJJ86850.1 hypothetical protein CLV77_1410 [Brevirhabdus pacifica]
MRHAIFAFFLAASPAFAGGVTVANCDPIDPGLLECDFTNRNTEAVAEFSYTVLVSEEGRAVPWVDTDSLSSRAMYQYQVAGGIEPAETIRILLQFPAVSERADPARLTYRVTVTEARGVDGSPLP